MYAIAGQVAKQCKRLFRKVHHQIDPNFLFGVRRVYAAPLSASSSVMRASLDHPTVQRAVKLYSASCEALYLVAVVGESEIRLNGYEANLVGRFYEQPIGADYGQTPGQSHYLLTRLTDRVGTQAQCLERVHPYYRYNPYDVLFSMRLELADLETHFQEALNNYHRLINVDGAV